MRKSHGKRGEVSPFAGEEAGARVGEWLRRRHPGKTAARGAADTGAAIDTVESWLRGGAPSLRWFVVLVGVYGPAFLAAVCPRLDWLDAAANAAERAAIEQEMAALDARRRELEGR